MNPGDNRWEKWNLNVDDTNFELAGAPGRTRTSNLLIRSQKNSFFKVLYQVLLIAIEYGIPMVYAYSPLLSVAIDLYAF